MPYVIPHVKVSREASGVRVTPLTARKGELGT